MRRLKRTEMVSLTIPAGTTGTKFTYPDISVLRNDTTQDIIIKGLVTRMQEVFPVSADSIPVATYAQLQNLSLTLYVQNEESVRRIPLISLLVDAQASGTATTSWEFEELELENLMVDWDKSFLEASQPVGNEADFCVLLEVRYKKLQPGAWAIITKGQIPGM